MAGPLPSLGPGWRPRVLRVAEGLGAEVSDEAARGLGTWLDAIATWNARVDLTAARNADELVDLMLADALVVAAETAPGARVVDVGTGAGAPGLALAIVRPDLDVTMIEPMQKRVAFLRTVVGTLGLGSARVVRARGEDAAAKGDRFDVALARATLAPPSWLALGASLVNDAGSVWVLLAREPPPALPGWSVTADRAYAWPLTAAARRVVRYGRSPAG